MALKSVIILLWLGICLAKEKKPEWVIGEKKREYGEPYGQLTKLQTECEVESLATGSLLADNYNSLDEETEWDARMHSDYLTEHLGFFAVIGSGTWGSNGKTTYSHKESKKLQEKGKWTGNSKVGESAYWALENQWVYMMGDSTLRQVWATFASPEAGNDFERNSKEWTRERCIKQYPHRKRHPEGNYPEEGWGGKCGNNEVTCHLSGYGKQGKLTYDWKHFPYEDYDQWVFSNEGMWGNNNTEGSRTQNLEAPGEGEGAHDHHHHRHQRERKRGRRRRRLEGEGKEEPAVSATATAGESSGGSGGGFAGFPTRRPDVLVNQMALHVCFHAYDNHYKSINNTFVEYHESLLPTAMQAMKTAVNRPLPDGTPIPADKQTVVIIATSGRIGNPDLNLDNCIWRFNRQLSIEAHKVGFPVFDREEIERRLLRKSDSFLGKHTGKNIKPNMHLPAPGPQIVATALLAMISCLRRDAKPENMKGAHEGYIPMGPNT
jgi:hypothetical protein